MSNDFGEFGEAAALNFQKPPSIETHAELEFYIAELEPFANRRRSRGLELELGEGRPYSSLNVNVRLEQFSVVTAVMSFEPSESVEERLIDLQMLGELSEAEAAWLGAAWTVAQEVEQGLWSFELEDLMDRSPFEISDISDYLLGEELGDGVSIKADWKYAANDYSSEVLRKWPTVPVRNIRVVGREGVPYRYCLFPDGREELSTEELIPPGLSGEVQAYHEPASF